MKLLFQFNYTRQIVIVTFIVLFSYLLIPSSFAQTSTSGTDVSATVGDYYLSASGTTEGQATVTLQTSSGQQMATTVALSNGTFSFSQILIQSGFSGFCLSAKSSLTSATSTVCFTFAPASSDINVKDIGIPMQSNNSTTPNQVPVATGYTVPNAIVTIQLPDGTSLQTTADASGYYQFFQTRSLGSLTPTSGLLQSRAGDTSSPSNSDNAPDSSTREESDTESNGFSSFVIYLIIGIFFIVLILILLLFRKKIAGLIARFRKEPQKKLHHSWWMGY